MKKLIIVAAVALASVASQAAQFMWSSSGKMTDADGNVYTSAAAYAAGLNGGSLVLVLLKDGTYDGDVSVLANQTAPTWKASPSSKKGTVSGSYSFTYESNVLKNGDILGVMFKDASGDLSQLVYADKSVMADTYTVAGLTDDTWSGSAFTFATGGNFGAASVPEPTSGLLLLLGMAGLALKRKHA